MMILILSESNIFIIVSFIHDHPSPYPYPRHSVASNPFRRGHYELIYL